MMSERPDGALTVYERLLVAWNRRDAAAFARLFAARGSAVGLDGSTMNGPFEIESTLGRIFAEHATAAYVARVRDVRTLGGDVTLLQAVVGMVPAGKTELNPAVSAIQSVVLVSEGGELRVALLHNTPAAFHGRAQAAAELTEELTRVLRSGQIVHVPEIRCVMLGAER